MLAVMLTVASCTAELAPTPARSPTEPSHTATPVPSPSPLASPTASPTPTLAPTTVPTPAASPTATPSPTATLTASEAAKQAAGASTVRIGTLGTWTNGTYKTTSTVGTGLIYDEEGYIVTNFHVVEYFLYLAGQSGEGLSELIAVEVRSVGVGPVTTYKGTVLGYDSRRDLAVLKIDGDKAFPVANIGSHASLRAGDGLTALGYPGGTVLAPSLETRVGQFATAWQAGGRTLLQHSSRVVGGFSGGPLVDTNGRVVAINAFYFDQETDGELLPIPIESYALSIAIDDVLANLDAMESGLVYTGGEPAEFGLLNSRVELPNAWVMDSNDTRFAVEATTQFEAHVIVRSEQRDLDQPAREVFTAAEELFTGTVAFDQGSVQSEVIEDFGVSVGFYLGSYRTGPSEPYWYRASLWLAQGAEIVNIDARAPAERYLAAIAGVVEAINSLTGQSVAQIAADLDFAVVTGPKELDGLTVELDRALSLTDGEVVGVEPSALSILTHGHVVGRVAVARLLLTNSSEEAIAVTRESVRFTGEDGTEYTPPNVGSLIQLFRIEDFGFAAFFDFDFTQIFTTESSLVVSGGAVALSGTIMVGPGQSVLVWVAAPTPLHAVLNGVTISRGDATAVFELGPGSEPESGFFFE